MKRKVENAFAHVRETALLVGERALPQLRRKRERQELKQEIKVLEDVRGIFEKFGRDVSTESLIQQATEVLLHTFGAGQVVNRSYNDWEEAFRAYSQGKNQLGLYVHSENFIIWFEKPKGGKNWRELNFCYKPVYNGAFGGGD